jgi:preprotein translocase subunit SecB
MADTDSQTDPSAADAKQPQPTPVIRIMGQYIRDLSFENIAAQKKQTVNTQPDIKVSFGIDAKRREDEGNYEVVVKMIANSQTTDADPQPLFLLELEYVGLFTIQNIPENQISMALLIECPRLLFPFIRRTAHDMTRDGGFPALNIDHVDFVELYKKNIMQKMGENAVKN